MVQKMVPYLKKVLNEDGDYFLNMPYYVYY